MLSDLRVLDLSGEPGFLAGKIMGDLGADVVKLEPPGGDPARRRPPFLGDRVDPERSLLWLALNTSKRGISLALDDSRGAELFRRLCGQVDVVLESGAPGSLAARGIGFGDLRESCPALVWCSITPFGQTGPRAPWRGGDLVAVAAGGNASVTGDPDRPPVRCSLPTAYYHAAPEAVLGILMALESRDADGQGQLVDVSLQECQQQTLLSGAAQLPLHGRVPARPGARVGGTREIWPTRDGHVSFGLRGGPARVPGLRAMVGLMHEHGMAPDWLRELDWSNYSHVTATPEEIARLEQVFGAFFASREMGELYAAALERRILLAPCNDAGAILSHAQLRDRELFVTLDYPELGAAIEHPDFFARTSGPRVRIRRRAPRLGEHNAEVYGGLGIAPSALEKLSADGVV